MRINSIASTILAIILVGCGGGGGQPTTPIIEAYPQIIDNNIKNKFAIKSVNMVLNSDSLLGLPGWTNIDDHIKNIKALGANDVKVTISAGYYDTPSSNSPNSNINFNPSDNDLLTFFRKLKAAGLTITVYPFVHKNTNVTNLLSTVHSSPSNFDEWISNHTSSMSRIANIAQQGSVDRFVIIGDEVQHLTYDVKNQNGWLNLITEIRKVYKGQLTTVIYSNGMYYNGKNQVDMVGETILSKLDIIGVGWFPKYLTNSNNPTVADLIAGWKNNTNGVDTIKFFELVNQKYKKPIWIADMAIHSFDGDNIDPDNIYNNLINLVTDEQEQADEYEALFTVLSYNMGNWFLGMSIDSYNNFPSNYTLPRHLNSPYSEDIRGKIAEGVVRKWYRQKM